MRTGLLRFWGYTVAVVKFPGPWVSYVAELAATDVTAGGHVYRSGSGRRFSEGGASPYPLNICLVRRPASCML